MQVLVGRNCTHGGSERRVLWSLDSNVLLHLCWVSKHPLRSELSKGRETDGHENALRCVTVVAALSSVFGLFRSR